MNLVILFLSIMALTSAVKLNENKSESFLSLLHSHKSMNNRFGSTIAKRNLNLEELFLNRGFKFK